MATSSSLPEVVNFYVKQGDTLIRRFEFVDQQDNPVNVSAAVFKLIIDGEPDLTLGNGLELIVDDDMNKVRLRKDITWTGRRKYELERVMGGVTWTPFAGRIVSKSELDENG